MALAIASTQTNNIFGQDSFAFEPHPENLSQESFSGELTLLRQQSKQLAQLIDVMPTGLVMLDGDGVVIKINKVASQLLDEPILGQAWFDVIRRSFKPRADDWHEVSLKDGRRVKLEITALGEQPGQLIMITDLTETRLLQDKLSHMQRLSSLGRMVSTLAHQIRTPLSSAMLYGANLGNTSLSDTSRVNFQDKLMSRLQDLEAQVNDMLLFAKSGNQQVVSTLEMNQLVEKSIASVDAILKKAEAKIHFTRCGRDCKVLGNESALMGALQNLFQNSIQVIKTNVEISVNIESHGQHVYISIKDNGKGIDPEYVDKIFEPFYTSRVQGTGLGLAVVKSVATAHQGEVKLISRKGEGANFCIKLPLLMAGQPLNNNPVDLSNQFQEVAHG
ncbi:sensor histidine kinase [Thalassotalea atypica]|uniref:sensor histidine kinase n=1 Tax=Thalassotalea atypica TaxID=2054316 RepID=UPI0025747A44|nr:ATP-binding protein [Thalassotalea atypica]